MDKRNSILNVVISASTKLITMILVIFVKRYLIQYCGNDANGLNTLYISIIGFLTVAELGIGTAITFCMYKPIVDNDVEKVAALYRMFRRMYLGIAGIVFLGGCTILPFLPQLTKGYERVDVNLCGTFLLMLISVIITYLFGAKTALINAHRYNYITVAINSGGLLLQYVMQIAAVVIFHSYSYYLGCRIVSALLQWGVTEYIVQKRYPHILKLRSKVDSTTKATLVRNIKAMFMHKFGWAMSEQAGNVVISTFIGVAVLGAYSNYTTVIASLRGLVKLLFTPLVSSFGHVYAKYSKDTTKHYFEGFHLLAYAGGMVCYLGFYAVIDSFVSLFFLPELVMDRNIVFLVTFGGFIRYMRDYMDTFRDATGTFYHDRWKPLIESCINVIISIVLIQKMGIKGVLVAMVFTDLLISYVVGPFVLYRYAFEAHPIRYYLQNYGGVLFFGIMMLVMDICLVDTGNHMENLIINGFISVGISLGACVLVILVNWKKYGIILESIKQRK